MAPMLTADSTFDGSGLALAHHWVQPDDVTSFKHDNIKKRSTGKAALVKAPAGAIEHFGKVKDMPSLEAATSGLAPLPVPAASAQATPAPCACFEELCNDGSAWNWGNWCVKLYRFTINIFKQLYLLFVTMSLPTNHLMLTFRTLPRDFNEPSSNSDYLACRFRNAVMPTRGRLHERKSLLIKINRFFIEFPVLGIPGIVRFIDVRTQWFDDGVAAAVADGIKQVVIIAAGYDTRAYRLARPGVRFYEIDLPHASRRKQELVRALLPVPEYPRPEFVAADLAAVRLVDALAPTSFDPSQRTLFIAEGLLYYLPASAVQQLLTCISSISRPGSRLMLDFLHLSALSGSSWCPGFETLMLSVWNKGEVMYSGIDERLDAVEALLHLFDFQLQQCLEAKDIVKVYMPHAHFRSHPPIVCPYFGYLAAEKV